MKVSRLPQLIRRAGSAVAGWCKNLARRPVAGMLVLLFLAGFGMVLTASVIGIPVPRIQDEFAYLLSADTFTEGRLTNPTHPYWRHFETFHVIHEPTYQAKYPPAQGAFLALGNVLGHPIIGVWLSVLMMVAATAWALRGILETQWAFLATFLLTLELGIASGWAQTYWGGAVAAGAGALLFGAAARLTRGDAGWRVGCLGGLGLAVLANSRPLEGLLLALAAGIWIAIARLRKHTTRRWIPTVLPALVLGLGGVLLTAVYNHAVTGNYATFPYSVHADYSGLSSSLFLLPAATEEHREVHPQIQRLNEEWDEQRDQAREDGVAGALRRLPGLLRNVAGPSFGLLLLLPLVRNSAGATPAVLLFLPVLISVLLSTLAQPHYLAPAVAPLYCIIGLVACRVHARRHKPVGPPLLIALVILTIGDVPTYVRAHLERRGDWADQRHAISTRLSPEPGSDLVFVHYNDGHPVHYEWIYNRANIDRAEIVWARPLGPAADSLLVDYFDQHRVWDLDVNRSGNPLTLRRRVDSTRNEEIPDLSQKETRHEMELAAE